METRILSVQRMETALHIAATDGHLELVKLLVEKYKVDIESKTGVRIQLLIDLRKLGLSSYEL